MSNITKVNSYGDLQSLRKERDRLQRILNDENEAEIPRIVAPTPIRFKKPSPALIELLNIPGSNISNTTKSSRNRTPAKNKKKEFKEIIPPIVNARDLPPALPQPVHTLMSLNPQARRRITTKFTKKSKGGKNKTKKRKAKKTKKNKKNKK